MIVLQNVYQVVVRPTFLILFLFGFLGAECSRVTGGDTPPDTAKAEAEQQAKVEAAEKAAEEARKKAEAAKQAGDAAKAAEEERKQKEAEAEAEKQRQIKTAVKTAASGVNRAHKAVERVAAAKQPLNGTGLASGKPFSILESEVKKARSEAFKAYDATHAATEVSAAFDKAEEVSLAANKAEKQARIAEDFVSRFQSQFTFNASEKALFPSITDRKFDPKFTTECNNYVKGLLQSLPDNLISSSTHPGCDTVTPGSRFSCFCEYKISGESFYKK